VNHAFLIAETLVRWLPSGVGARLRLGDTGLAGALARSLPDRGGT
jgi:hypothetical protein